MVEPLSPMALPRRASGGVFGFTAVFPKNPYHSRGQSPRFFKSVYEHFYYERGFKVFNLYISTTKGFLRLDQSFQNYDRIRDYFVNNYPNTTSRPFGRVFMLPLILSLAGSAGIFLGYQFGSSIGQSIRPGNPTASDEWGAVGAIVGPMVAIVICIGISHLDLRSRLDA